MFCHLPLPIVPSLSVLHLQIRRYAEKRMLEQQIKNLSEEVSQRDHMDQEMEACVCDLFEKLRLMEESNKQLTAKLGAAGAQVAAAQ
eukprot:365130-Chlamydomonas_euryale.AAC.20